MIIFLFTHNIMTNFIISKEGVQSIFPGLFGLFIRHFTFKQMIYINLIFVYYWQCTNIKHVFISPTFYCIPLLNSKFDEKIMKLCDVNSVSCQRNLQYGKFVNFINSFVTRRAERKRTVKPIEVLLIV